MRRVFVLVLLTIGVAFAPQIAMRGSAQRATESARPRQASTPPRTATPAPSGTFDTVVKPFVAQNCVTCHGNKKQEKGLNLQSFETAASLVEHGERWEDVIGKLRGKEMPPIEEEQPEEADRQAVAAWLEAELQRIERTTPPDPGRVTARRLNRTEYNNTIRELLGVDVRPADDFPQDDSGYGFDNIADVLSLSPVLMEKYVAAADRVTRMALFGPPRMSPTLVRLRSEGRRVQELRSVPEAYDATGLSLPNAFHAIHRVPVDGEYLVRVVLGGLAAEGVDARDDRALGRREAGTDDHARSGTGSVVCRRPPGLRRTGGAVPRSPRRGRSLALRGHPEDLRGTAGSLQRAEPVDAPGHAARVQSAGECAARTARAAEEAVRGSRRGAREDSAQRRARERRRSRRALRRT